jgi:hypothetical protein
VDSRERVELDVAHLFARGLRQVLGGETCRLE